MLYHGPIQELRPTASRATVGKLMGETPNVKESASTDVVFLGTIRKHGDSGLTSILDVSGETGKRDPVWYRPTDINVKRDIRRFAPGDRVIVRVTGSAQDVIVKVTAPLDDDSQKIAPEPTRAQESIPHAEPPEHIRRMPPEIRAANERHMTQIAERRAARRAIDTDTAADALARLQQTSRDYAQAPAYTSERTCKGCGVQLHKSTNAPGGLCPPCLRKDNERIAAQSMASEPVKPVKGKRATRRR